MNEKTAKLIRRFAKTMKLKDTREVKRIWFQGNHRQRTTLRKEMKQAINASS